MPNLNAVLGEEIRRLARKEIRVQTKSLHDAVSRYRSDIATLRKQNKDLERRLNRLAKGKPGPAAEDAADGGDGGGRRPRFSPGWVKKHRNKLGLSAADYGKLVGVSGLTIYNWEKGGSSPRTRQLQAWGEVRTLGKREAKRRLEQM